MQTKNLIASFALGMTLTAISILPSYAETKTPNLYNLSSYNHRGYRIKVTYSTSSITGRPLFHYEDKEQTLDFTGDEIRTAELEIGTLVTVTTRRTVDTGSTTFSLLIPRVNLGENNQAQIETDGITTVNKFSTIPVFNQGQTQTYIITPLKGTAESVAF
ncbi:hypothetical protein I8748_20930 [Nostoc sp. CENA67]|uniref:Uncharacterized protein n=1 Tax=Amazonocrinis nigriterrae CENA67 TaxID=2794033 RepID=A0A8J7HW31_9NOST|nr:hypothetical protein [Amazonocrinis nigriterrae]MBH8564618.1 hypothetical protein [Amazonocrinis nigriterrae CENA67]